VGNPRCDPAPFPFNSIFQNGPEPSRVRCAAPIRRALDRSGGRFFQQRQGMLADPYADKNNANHGQCLVFAVTETSCPTRPLLPILRFLLTAQEGGL
jgi:hypothetical protein